MKVTIYSRKSCGPCHMVKQILNKKGIQFTNRDVDEDDEAASEAFAYTGMSVVPVTVVTDGEKKTVITGYNLSRLIPAIS